MNRGPEVVSGMGPLGQKRLGFGAGWQRLRKDELRGSVQPGFFRYVILPMAAAGALWQILPNAGFGDLQFLLTVLPQG